VADFSFDYEIHKESGEDIKASVHTTGRRFSSAVASATEMMIEAGRPWSVGETGTLEIACPCGLDYLMTGPRRFIVYKHQTAMKGLDND